MKGDTTPALDEASPGDPGDRDQAVCFRIGEAEFAIAVDQVERVARVPPLTAVPFPPPDVIGVVGLNGTVLPVIDLGTRLVSEPADRSGRLLLVTVPSTSEAVALLVDEVVGLIGTSVMVDAVPPEVERSLPEGWLAGVLAPTDDRLVALLDIDELLAKDPEENNAR